MRTIRMIVGVAGEDFGWAPGELVTLDDAEAAKWADGERAVYEDGSYELPGGATGEAGLLAEADDLGQEHEHPGTGVPMTGVEVPADGTEHELAAGVDGGVITEPGGAGDDQVAAELGGGDFMLPDADPGAEAWDEASAGLGGVVLHPDAVEPPAGNASREAWATYVLDVLKVDPAAIEGKSRNELREQYGAGGAE